MNTYWDEDKKTWVVRPATSSVEACGCGGLCIHHKDFRAAGTDIKLTEQQITSPDLMAQGWHHCNHFSRTGSDEPVQCQTIVAPSSSFCQAHRPRTEVATRVDVSHTCKWPHSYCGRWIAASDTYCIRHANEMAAIEPDADGDVIDTILATRIDRSLLKFRGFRKLHDMETIHFRIKVDGKRDNVLMFHALLAKADSDYPFRPDRRPSTPVPGCEKCHGYVWKNAVLTPADFKKAAKQAGVHAKPKLYITSTKCGGKVRDVQVGANA